MNAVIVWADRHIDLMVLPDGKRHYSAARRTDRSLASLDSDPQSVSYERINFEVVGDLPDGRVVFREFGTNFERYEIRLRASDPFSLDRLNNAIAQCPQPFILLGCEKRLEWTDLGQVPHWSLYGLAAPDPVVNCRTTERRWEEIPDRGVLPVRVVRAIDIS